MGLVMNLDEDQAVAMDEYGRIVRKDMFKGFTPAQRIRLLQENEELLRIKRERDQAERDHANDWAVQQAMAARAMEESHLEEKYLRDVELSKHMSVLEQQREEAAQRKSQQEREKFGTIGRGFYDNFGKSCR
jgi:hypothetical protein